jgi:hypothetical protein
VVSLVIFVFRAVRIRPGNAFEWCMMWFVLFALVEGITVNVVEGELSGLAFGMALGLVFTRQHRGEAIG